MKEFLDKHLADLIKVIQVIDNLTGDHIPDTITADIEKLRQYVTDSIANFQQNAPKTPEQTAQLRALIAGFSDKPYWKVID